MELGLIKVWDFPKIKMTYMDQQLIHYKVKENCLITMDDVNLCLEAIEEFDSENVYLNLYELGKNSKIMEDVKAWASDSKGNKQTVADAIVIQSLAHKLIANAYLKINRPPLPTKIFTNYERALEWLLKQKSP